MEISVIEAEPIKPAIEGGPPVRSAFLPYGAPLIGDEEIAEVVDTLRSGWLSTGPKTRRFEEEFRRYIGCRHAIAVNSCTAALHLALDALGVGPGDEVITSPMTFPATANVIVHCGARPVFVDVDPSTMNIAPDNISAAITSRTKVLLPVHMAGRPCAMQSILNLARKHHAYLVDDAAHAVEAFSQTEKIGNIGDASAFSFYATKNLTTGEGGMVTTNDEALAERIRTKSLHGLTHDAWKRYGADGFKQYDAVVAGYKYNMMDLQAAMGIHQLARVGASLKIRERHWQRYQQGLADLPELELPAPCDDGQHARHLYTLLPRLETLSIDRDRFINALRAENIGASVHFRTVHLHSFYREKYGYRPGDFPQAEAISERTMSLPLSAKLTDDDVEDVIRAVRKIVRAYRR